MPKVQYGTKIIDYTFREKTGLKSHYISVQKGEGVILKGEAVSETKADQLILKKARWILDKMELVRSIRKDDIVTGSRIQYLGRKYYVELFLNNALSEITIDFTASSFKVRLPTDRHTQAHLQAAFKRFFTQKAQEKITPRVKKWAETTGLSYGKLQFRYMEKRWGSCTPSNNIVINIDAIRLPYTLIDYLIVHELVHTQIKNHSKEFWAEVARYIPNWKALDGRMYGMRL